VSAPVNVFISYAHEDSEQMLILRRQLSGPARSSELNFRIWHDQLLEGGEKWADEIKQQLETADLVVFLLSSALTDSDYVAEVEAPSVFARHERNECAVLTVLLHNVALKGTPFEPFQHVPVKPIDRYSHPDDAWVEVANVILKQVHTIRTKRLQASERASGSVPAADADPQSEGAAEAQTEPGARVFIFPPKLDIRRLREVVAAADLSAGRSWAAAALHLGPLLQTLKSAVQDKDLSAYQRAQCRELHDAITYLTRSWSSDSKRAELTGYAEDRRSRVLAALDRDLQ
jgi:hypothetical protein